ncbi:hypothetical protein GDO86_019008, partial [Hymenochirus boettgeri]
APHIPKQSDLLPKAFETFHVYLTWPVPYCAVYQEILSFISEEQRAPGMVRAEQGLLTRSTCASTVNVLLVNPRRFLASSFHSRATEKHGDPYTRILIGLIKTWYQASLGPYWILISDGACSKGSSKPETRREWVESKLLEISEKSGSHLEEQGSANVKPVSMPVAKCYTYTWEQDDFDILNRVLLGECQLETTDDDVNEEDEDMDLEEANDIGEELANSETPKRDSVNSKGYVYWNTPSDPKEDPAISNLTHSMSFVSSLSSCVDSGYVEDSDESSQESSDKTECQEEKNNLKFKQKFCQLFKTKCNQTKWKLRAELSPCASHPLLSPFPDLSKTIPLRRAGSMYTPQMQRVPVRSKRSQSLPQHALGSQFMDVQMNKKMPFKRRPFLSCDEDAKASTLRVVVFGSDRISGKVARAYSNLRLKESNCPCLTRFFKLQFYYIPVKRNSAPRTPLTISESPLKSPSPLGRYTPEDLPGEEESTNDMSHYKSPNSESKAPENTKMPILADMVRYYCRFATRSLLMQLYQAEITFDSGGKQTEVFIQCLELGHSAALRAIRASGAGSKRLGIDGDRDAIPFTLQIVYSKSSVSGRSRWSNGEKVCTSVSLRKSCRHNKMECLTLTMREVVKRHNSKTKKSYNQICNSQIKIDKAQIIAQHGSTFPLCLDQDERKILQRVKKCEVSPCYKPESRDSCRRNRLPSWSQTSHSQSEYCSLLCLPITTFSGDQA